MSIESSFGIIAKNRRRELGLTQDELARRVGCAPITLRKIEADDLRPSVQIAERMAMALNIPLEERAAFVKLARTDRMPAEEPTATPMPLPNEIGIEDLSGRAIRGYALGERLGNGGMGAVYRAVQPLVEREVAIKIILPQYANHPDFIRRFEAEAQLVARLEHPHIVPLYDYWREPSVAYLIMRLLRGGSVHSLLRNGTVLTPEVILRMMEQIGSALSSAHRAGVVHRDLKPANVLLDEDNNAYLADFGIAKNLSSPSSETQADMVIGSPDYISPEQIRSEFVRPQTDIYALGVMLYELLTGKVPFHGPTPFEVMHQHLSAPLPPLAANRIGLPKALDEVIEHATAKDPLQRYETVDTMVNDFRKALGLNLREINSNAVTSQPTAIPLTAIDNPYKGLRAFGEGDAQDFFGREALTQQLLVRLGEGGELARFLAVVGPSGSGKSSVVKAGLIPALRRGALPGSENWFIIEMMPGAHPLEELEAALLRVAVNPPASLIEQFHKDSRGLIRAVRRSLPNDPTIELVLVIDQFEEVFTLLQDENERLTFLGLLVSAILDENSRIRVILTLRADFIDRPLSYVDFGELMHKRMEIILPLTPDELESAIVAPAERVRLQFESGLVSAILHDLGDQPGTLPLLQYALTELYEKRTGNTLTKSAYQEIGGVLGALGRRAEEIFTGLDDESQTITKQLFLRLVTLGEGVEDTRRRALIAELENLQLDRVMDAKNYSRSFQKVLDAFGHARLLSFDRDPDTRGPTIEVAHEAIIREWTRLRDWLNESRTLVRMQRQLARATSEWESVQRDESFLLTGTKLAQYEGWLENIPVALTEHELSYLKNSITTRDQRVVEETIRQKRELETAQKLAETEKARADEQTQYASRVQVRNRIIAIAGAIALLLAGLAGAFGVQSNRNLSAAQNNAATAVANYQQAESERLGAEGIALVQAPGGNPETAALLAIHGLQMVYSPQADAALQLALSRLYTQRVLAPTIRKGPLYSIAISPDGRTAFTSDLVLRDAETGNIANYLVTNDWGTHVTFSPDGRWALAGIYGDRTARMWDVKTGKEFQVFSGHTDRVLEGAFSPDGKWVITGSADKTARLWDVATGKEVRVFTGHTDQVQSVAFSPDGKQVLTGSSDMTARLWDVTTGETLRIFKVDDSDILAEILSVVFSPDGKWILASSAAKIAWLWDAETGELLRQFKGHAGAIRSAVFSSDGKRMLTASDDMTARLWETETGELLRVFGGHTDGVGKAVFAPDGQSVFTAGWDSTIRQWNLGPDEHVFALPVLTSYSLFASGGDSILLAGYEGKVAWLTDARTGRELTRFSGHTDKISSIEVSKDQKYVLTGSYDKTARLWNAATGQELRIFRGHTDFVNANFSEDGKFILTWGRDKTVRIWVAATGQELRVFQFKSATDMPTAVAISPDDTSVLVNVPDDPGFTIWDIESGERFYTWNLRNKPVIFSLSFSPDGRYILSSANDGKVQVWEVGADAPLQTFNHPGAVNFASYSPDGKFIWTGCADGKVRQWDVTTGQLVRVFSGPRGYSGIDDISPDGKSVLIEYDDQSVHMYDVDYHDTIRYACSRLVRDLTSDERMAYNIIDTKSTCP